MKKLALLAVAACAAVLGQDKKASEPQVPMTKTYEASAEKVFGALVQAVSDFEIKTALKDGCLLKFSTLRPYTEVEKQSNASREELNAKIRSVHAQFPNLAGLGDQLSPLDLRHPVDWTILCTESDGKTTVKISAIQRIPLLTGDFKVAVLPEDLKRTDPDRETAIQVFSGIWSSMDHAIPSTVAPTLKEPKQ